MTPKRIQLSRKKGWKMPPNTVKVDRSTRYGNPFKVGEPGVPDAATAKRKYLVFLAGGFGLGAGFGLRRARLGDVRALRGKDLACWCKLSEPCHADVLLEVANR